MGSESFRQSYNETDIQILAGSPRFLVAADAYGADRCTLANVLALAFTGPPYIPHNLDPMAFADLVFEVVRRIHAGEIHIQETWKRDYAHFYADRTSCRTDA